MDINKQRLGQEPKYETESEAREETKPNVSYHIMYKEMVKLSNVQRATFSTVPQQQVTVSDLGEQEQAGAGGANTAARKTLKANLTKNISK